MNRCGYILPALMAGVFISLFPVSDLRAQEFQAVTNLLGAHERFYAGDMSSLPEGEFLERGRLIVDFLDSRPTGVTAETAAYKEKRQRYLTMLTANKERVSKIATRQPENYMTEKARWLARRLDGFLIRQTEPTTPPGLSGPSKGFAYYPGGGTKTPGVGILGGNSNAHKKEPGL